MDFAVCSKDIMERVTTDGRHCQNMNVSNECVKSAIIIFPLIINSRSTLVKRFVFRIDSRILCHEAFIIQKCN